MTASPLFTRVLTLGFSVLFAGVASAASIDWGLGPTTISGDSDVATSGTILAAYNFGAGTTGTTVINGVTFQNAFSSSLGQVTLPVTLGTGPGSLTVSGSLIFSGNPFGTPALAPFSSLSAPYQTLLNSGLLGGNSSTVLTFTIGGLTPGQTYRIQVWSNDSRSTGVPRTTILTSNDLSVTLRQNTAASGGGGVGQYVYGIFTASSPTQTFVASSATSAVVSGLVIAAVPEPGVTGAATGLALLAFLAHRRRSRRA